MDGVQQKKVEYIAIQPSDLMRENTKPYNLGKEDLLKPMKLFE